MEITLSSAVRTSLFSSQKVAALQARTQKHLATGRKFTSVLDNARAVILSQRLSSRASNLLAVKSNIGQGASKLSTALKGLEATGGLLEQMKAVALQHAASNSASEQAALSGQFDVLKEQFDGLVRDSSYGGTNLIDAAPDDLDLSFNEDGSSGITVSGAASDSAALGVTLTVSTIAAAIDTVRATAQSIGSSAAVLDIRGEFTDNLVNTLEEGAAKLVNADLNEEAALALTLQTRGLLAAAATGIAAQSERSILQLF